MSLKDIRRLLNDPRAVVHSAKARKHHGREFLTQIAELQHVELQAYDTAYPVRPPPPTAWERTTQIAEVIVQNIGALLVFPELKPPRHHEEEGTALHIEPFDLVYKDLQNDETEEKEEDKRIADVIIAPDKQTVLFAFQVAMSWARLTLRGHSVLDVGAADIGHRIRIATTQVVDDMTKPQHEWRFRDGLRWIGELSGSDI